VTRSLIKFAHTHIHSHIVIHNALTNLRPEVLLWKAHNTFVKRVALDTERDTAKVKRQTGNVRRETCNVQRQKRFWVCNSWRQLLLQSTHTWIRECHNGCHNWQPPTQLLWPQNAEWFDSVDATIAATLVAHWKFTQLTGKLANLATDWGKRTILSESVGGIFFFGLSLCCCCWCRKLVVVLLVAAAKLTCCTMRTKRRSTKNSCAVAVAVGVSIAAQLQLLPNELLQIRQKCQETPTKLQGATCLMPHAPFMPEHSQPTECSQM